MNRPHLNFAVNYEKNFSLVKKIFEANYNNCSNFPLNEVYDQLDRDINLYSLLGAEKISDSF